MREIREQHKVSNRHFFHLHFCDVMDDGCLFATFDAAVDDSKYRISAGGTTRKCKFNSCWENLYLKLIECIEI
jgi:hypothetical protein